MARDTDTAANGPVDRLRSEARNLLGAFGGRALSSVQEKVEGMTDRLTDYAEGGAGPGLMAAVTGAKDLAEGESPVRSMLGAGMTAAKEKVAGMFGGGGKDGQGKRLKVTNVAESIDVGVPITLAYNQWTQLSDFPSFMKKVESVEQPEPQKATWKAQVFWSHRTWEATILEQVPDERIIWRSKGAKGHVDGTVTFHELGPNLTRILLVLEYYPQGLFEHTGNLWRAQGRRARLELKHFRRHVMTEAVRHPDDIEGWRGVIHDGEVVQDEDEYQDQDQDRADEGDEGPEDRDGADEEAAEDYDGERESRRGARRGSDRGRRGADGSPDGSSGRDRRSAGRPRQSARSGRTAERRPRAQASRESEEQ